MATSGATEPALQARPLPRPRPRDVLGGSWETFFALAFAFGFTSFVSLLSAGFDLALAVALAVAFAVALAAVFAVAFAVVFALAFALALAFGGSATFLPLRPRLAGRLAALIAFWSWEVTVTAT